MKKVFTLFVTVFFTVVIIAQVPQKTSYQAVIRNSTNGLVTNHAVGMKISILQGSATGSPVYVETQAPTTNANGLVSVEIGGGTTVSGNFMDIDWSNGIYFIKTETDPSGGTSYTITGSSQLLSVPYSLYAKTSSDAVKLTGDQSIAGNKTFTGTINVSNKAITNLGNPLNDQDAVSKIYVDNKLPWIIFQDATQSVIGNNSPLINTGTRNLFIGKSSGMTNISGVYNTFLGSEAGFFNKIGNNNIAIGQNALRENDEGSDNIAIGANALEKNRVLTPGSLGGPGFYNIAIGRDAMRNSVSNGNIGIGQEVLRSLTAGSDNTALGVHVMRDLVTGWGNTAVGTSSMIYAVGEATNNVAIGVSSGAQMAGFGNVFIGYQSGIANKGSYNVFLGHLSGYSSTWQNVSNRLIINNADNDTPLIYGEFDNKIITLNGTVNIKDVLNLAPRTSAPSNPSEGDVYYNSTTHKLMVFDGSNWMACW